jgi:hypothetical protein
MVDMAAPYAGDFVRADELPERQRIPVRILFAGVEQLGNPSGSSQQPRARAVLSVANATDGRPWPRKIVLNKTNASILTSVFGKEGAGWVNQYITLWREPVMFQGKMVPGIKVMAGLDAQPAAAPPPAASVGAIPLPGPLPPPAAPAPSASPPSPGNGAATDMTGASMNMPGHTVPLPAGMPGADDLDDQIPF